MKIVSFTPCTFRTVNAGALRNATVAAALVAAGHQVTIVSADAADDLVEPSWSHVLSDAVDLVQAGPPRTRGINQLRRVIGGATGYDLRHYREADAVIAYNPDPLSFSRLARRTAFDRKKLYVDLTEWLTPTDLPGGWLSPYSWWYSAFMRDLPSRATAGFAISTAMAEHLSARGARSILVPPLHDPRTFPPESEESARRTDRTRLLVSGSGFVRGGKDLSSLVALCAALEAAPALGRKLSVHVAGRIDATGDAAIKRLGGVTEVINHGWLDWRRSIEIVSSVDWLLQFREPAGRRARFGFPSKVTESLMLGTPVIANTFSDTALHIRDGVNGILVPALTTIEISRALTRALSVRPSRVDIVQAARDLYSIDAFSPRISQFVDADVEEAA